jgi:DNA mismatch repair protein MutS2
VGIAAAEARAADAERKMHAALAEAEEERRRARAERRVAAHEARRQAEVAIAAIEAEIAEMRGSLARETLTEQRLDQAMARIDARLGLMPGVDDGREPAPARRPWKVGERALATSGWSGTIAGIDEAKGRATLEVNGLRVDVKLEELGMPARGGGAGGPAGHPKSGRRGDFGQTTGTPFATGAALARAVAATERRVRAVASSLDLRGARVDEALAMLDQYLDDAVHAGAGQVTVIHGHGSGAMRDAVRQMLSSHPLVRTWRPGDRGEGGDGATVVSF